LVLVVDADYRSRSELARIRERQQAGHNEAQALEQQIAGERARSDDDGAASARERSAPAERGMVQELERDKDERTTQPNSTNHYLVALLPVSAPVVGRASENWSAQSARLDSPASGPRRGRRIEELPVELRTQRDSSWTRDGLLQAGRARARCVCQLTANFSPLANTTRFEQ